MVCLVVAITLLLPDPDRVFQNAPYPLQTLASPPPWLPQEVKGAMCFQLCSQPPSVFKKEWRKTRLWHESCVLLQATGTQISSGPRLDVCICVYMCVHWCVWRSAGEGNKSWTHRGTTWGLSWCEEAGSELGCSKTPKWTISHRPQGLVLIDSGWTGVGGILVKYTLTWVTYCCLNPAQPADRGLIKWSRVWD